MTRLPALCAKVLPFLLLALMLPFAARGQAVSEPQRIVDRARIIVEDFKADPNFSGIRPFIQNAYGVIIIPQLLRGGFIVGGQYGNGVLLVRDVQSGAWSDPVFVVMVGASIGLQIGGEASDLLLTIMHEDAVAKLLAHQFKLGVDASAAIGPLGAGAGAATTTRFGEDVYIFSRNIGLFAGMTFDGTVITPRHEWNEIYYGRKVSPREIVAGRVRNSGAEALKRALAGF